MPRKPKDETREHLETVRKRAAERRGVPYTPRTMRPGRPHKKASVAVHDMAERIAKFRDSGLPVRSKLPKRTENDNRDAISAALDELRNGYTATEDRLQATMKELLKEGNTSGEARVQAEIAAVRKDRYRTTRTRLLKAWKAIGNTFPKNSRTTK